MNTVTTEDGYFTLLSPDTEETYHNKCGAWLETQAIYIKPVQFEERLKHTDNIRLFDPFFGLGYITLGCIVEFVETLEKTCQSGKTLEVIAIENDPSLIPVLMAVLEQFDQPCLKELKEAFAHKIYYRTQQDPIKNGDRFTLSLENYPVTIHFIYDDIRVALPTLESESLDCIFHDAFSSKKQPELWTQEIFNEYRRLLKPPKGVLHTYSQASHIRAAMRATGLHLYKSALVLTDGYPKPGTLGSIEPRPFQPPLDEFEVAILETRAAIPYRDNATFTSTREDILLRRKEEQDKYVGVSTTSIHKRFRPK